MIVMKKAIPRRTLLRGIGATLALPFLDGMVPAFAATPTKAPLRFGAVYVPNGLVMKGFTPTVEGAAYEMTPTLAPLAPYRDRLSVLSGLCNKQAFAWEGEGIGDHARASTSFLTGMHAKKTESNPQLINKAGDKSGISLDQIIAKAYAQETQLPSLELGLDSGEMAGACDPSYACPYDHTISWRSWTTPNPIDSNPRMVFARMFGASGTTDSTVRLARMKRDQSILDSLVEKIVGLRVKLGAGDSVKVNEYLEAVRDVERRIQMAEKQSDRELSLLEQPLGVPPTFEEHAKLMWDLLALAYQTDLTRVFTFMTACEVSARSYPEIGVPDAHHPITHNIVDPDPVRKVMKINAYHMEMFAHFIEKLKSIPDGDGTLLDHSVIIYGAGISNANVHSHDDLPIVLVGGLDGKVACGRHIRYPKDTPLTNLYVTLLDKFGIGLEKFGDSNGRLEGLSI